MAHKSAHITLAGGPMRFEVRTGSGQSLVLDDLEGGTGPSPAELIPAAVAGCTAMDVISILRKKRQDVARYEVRATGVQMEEHPHAFTRIDIVHTIEGPDIDTDAVRRAIELSATKYCSVGSTLSTGVTEIHHGYHIRDGAGRDEHGEVLVTGPNEDPHALGTRTTAAASA